MKSKAEPPDSLELAAKALRYKPPEYYDAIKESLDLRFGKVNEGIHGNILQGSGRTRAVKVEE